MNVLFLLTSLAKKNPINKRLNSKMFKSTEFGQLSRNERVCQKSGWQRSFSNPA